LLARWRRPIQRPRLSRKHPPMKEKIPTITPVAIPVRKPGPRRLSWDATTKYRCRRCPKASVVSSTATPLKILRIRMSFRWTWQFHADLCSPLRSLVKVAGCISQVTVTSLPIRAKMLNARPRPARAARRQRRRNRKNEALSAPALPGSLLRL
jgi:hypothetical protein